MFKNIYIRVIKEYWWLEVMVIYKERKASSLIVLVELKVKHEIFKKIIFRQFFKNKSLGR